MFLSLVHDCDRLTDSVYRLGRKVKDYVQYAGDRYFGGNHGIIRVLIEHTGNTVLIEGDIYDTQKLLALLGETDSEIIDNIDPYDLWDYIGDCLVPVIEDDDWLIERIDKVEEVEEVEEKQPLTFIQKQEIALLDSLLEGIEKLEKATKAKV